METIKSRGIPKPEHLSIQPLQGYNFKPISNRLLLQKERHFRLKTHSVFEVSMDSNSTYSDDDIKPSSISSHTSKETVNTIKKTKAKTW